MKTNMKHWLALGLIPLALTACGVAPDEPTTTVTETTTSSSWTPTTEAPASAEPTTEAPASADPADLSLSFGETFEWEDGVKATVSTPTSFTPTEYAAGGEGYPSHVKMTVTIVNGSDAPLDASFVSPTVQSGQREGDEVFDDGLEGSPLGSILPGRTVTYDAGYGVDDPSDIVAEFAPTWDHDYAYWE